MMSQIKNRDTKPELLVRSALHRAGFRFRLNQRIEGCRPDIVLPRFKTVIFVHGCFWHRHDGCKFAYTPKSRKDFWEKKFQENQARDARNNAALEDAGWKVLIIWECEATNTELLNNLFSSMDYST